MKVPPPDGERWTVRRVAQLIGISASAVGRIWQALGIHRTNRGASTPVLAACGGSAVPRMRRVKAKIPRYEVCECNRPACANCCLRRFFGIADTVTRAWQGLLDRDEDLQGGVLLITLTCRASADMTRRSGTAASASALAGAQGALAQPLGDHAGASAVPAVDRELAFHTVT